MKHAYLIMVHKNSYTLEKLLQLIDYNINSIFIHVDAKCKDFDKVKYASLVKKGQLFFCEERVNVSWGGYSQVLAELTLMKTALKQGPFVYYHLLSGQDLPLKPQKVIHEICNKTPNKVYLEYRTDIDKKTEFGKKVYQRVSVIHYLQEYRTRFNNRVLKNLILFIDRFLIGTQIFLLKRDLVKEKNISLVYGSNWFSCPEKVIEYVVNSEKIIENYFSKASFCDELFIQTILASTDCDFEIHSNMRKVDFNKGVGDGHPYIWRHHDFKELTKSDAFFARKFDENVDINIIDNVYELVINLSKK